jgi:hypothetical protein
MKKIIALCLAISAMGMVGALSAAPASAAVGEIDLACHSGINNCFLFGEQVGENVFTVNGGTVKCTTATFTGEGTGGTTAKTKGVSPETKDWTWHLVTVHPVYSGCKAFGQNVTISTTGCNFNLTATSKTVGTAVVECEKEKNITIKGNTTGCTVTVGAQTPTNNVVDFANAGTGETKDVTVTATIGTEPVEKGKATGITYTSTGGACGEGGSNGTYRGSVTEKCFNSAEHKTQVACTLVETVNAAGEIE